ncbi:hypothetical protein Tco_0273454, partial [Tanacetum coccineum]
AMEIGPWRVGYIIIPARTRKSEPNSFTLEARALSYATVYEGASDTVYWVCLTLEVLKLAADTGTPRTVNVTNHKPPSGTPPRDIMEEVA